MRTIYPSTTGQRISNSSVISQGGGLGLGDRGAGAHMPMFSDNPYTSNDYVHRWRQYVMMYETSWEARKIVRIIPEDALRKQWEANDIPEDMAKAIQGRLERMQFLNVLKRSLMLERLLGGCLTFMGIDDNNDKPEVEYKPSEGKALRFCNSIPISRISRVGWNTDPLSENYMRPDMFLINGTEVHVSRCLVWDGEPLFDPYDFALTNFRSNLAGFGPSKLAPVWDDIIKAVGTRQAAYQLIQTNNAILMAVRDLQDLNGTKSGKAALNKLRDIANQLSVYKAAMIDGDKVDIKQSAASFGSVPELILTFIQVLSAASDIPATRFLGQAPGGLNATGESDLENYYNVIDAYQRQRIEPQLRRTYDIVGYSLFKNEWHKHREKLTFRFPPLWNIDELEEADKNAKNIENVMRLFDAGFVDEKKVIDELNAKGCLSVDLDETDIQIRDDLGYGMGGEGEAGADIGAGQINPQDQVSRLRSMVKAPAGDSKTPNGLQNAIYLENLPEPTPKQVSAGNYKKHHLRLHGLDIAIENPQGSVRRGVGQDGKSWECELPAHYGYVKKTEGADGDHVDVYVGPNEESELVFIVDQKDLATGEFDEHKCIFGCLSMAQAKELYAGGFSDGKGPDRVGSIVPVHVSKFKQWLSDGDTKKAFSNSDGPYIYEAVWFPGQNKEERMVLSAMDDAEAFRIASNVGVKRNIDGAPETLTRIV